MLADTRYVNTPPRYRLLNDVDQHWVYDIENIHQQSQIRGGKLRSRKDTILGWEVQARDVCSRDREFYGKGVRWCGCLLWCRCILLCGCAV